MSLLPLPGQPTCATRVDWRESYSDASACSRSAAALSALLVNLRPSLRVSSSRYRAWAGSGWAQGVVPAGAWVNALKSSQSLVDPSLVTATGKAGSMGHHLRHPHSNLPPPHPQLGPDRLLLLRGDPETPQALVGKLVPLQPGRGEGGWRRIQWEVDLKAAGWTFQDHNKTDGWRVQAARRPRLGTTAWQRFTRHVSAA